MTDPVTQAAGSGVNRRVVAVAVSLLLGIPALAQQFPAYRAARFPGSQNPNVSGLWQAVNSANFDIEAHEAGPSPFPALTGAIGAQAAGLGIVEGGKLPYKPEALEQRKQNFAKRMNRPVDRESNDSTGDPEAKCYLPGVPRATYIGLPFQIVQAPKQILIAYEFAAATRIVYMDRKPKVPSDSWMGWSIGRFEGDTLVIDVTNQNDRTWLDRAGNFHSDALHVVERYTPLTPYHLNYEATLEDPKVFTRPWTMRMPLYRRIEQNAQLLEFKCVEFTEEYIYGHLLEKTGK